MLETITYENMRCINQMNVDTYTESFCCYIYDEAKKDVIDTIDDTEKASENEKNISELEFVFGEYNEKTHFCYRLPYCYIQTSDGKLIKSENDN